ncbi:MAG: amidase, partial [Oleiphilaceae bacterium]|nr:amidase [Oleiphilaceae bacterium]
QPPRNRAFSGVPTVIKDNIPVAGMPTGFGSQALRGQIAARHGSYTRQYQSLGMTILGKSSLPEFGFNATTEPMHRAATPNPWHPEHSAGASSGGSAALVAAGVVPIAHGNDGGGSIRIPAACCGLVGLKPSRDRHVNTAMARSLPVNIVSEGVLTRSVRDTATFHFEMQTAYRHRQLPLLPHVQGPGKTRLRIGLFDESVTGAPTDKATRQIVHAVADTLSSLGHTVVPIRNPVDAGFAEDFARYWGMMAFMVKHGGRLSLPGAFTPRALDPLSHGLARYYLRHALATPLIIKRLRQHGHAFAEQFERVDVMLSPVLSQAPAPLGHLHPEQDFEVLFNKLRSYVGFTPIANVAGTPAMSLPGGLNAQGLPIGVQLFADWGHEKALLELAFELEAARPFPRIQQSHTSKVVTRAQAGEALTL